MTHTEHAELRRLIRSDFDYDAMMQCAWLLSAEYPFLGFGYLGESAAGRGIPRFSLGEGKKEIYYIGVHHGAERITGAVLVDAITGEAQYYSREEVSRMTPAQIKRHMAVIEKSMTRW